VNQDELGKSKQHQRKGTEKDISLKRSDISWKVYNFPVETTNCKSTNWKNSGNTADGNQTCSFAHEQFPDTRRSACEHLAEERVTPAMMEYLVHLEVLIGCRHRSS
jgi:hypothetical protein